MLSNIVQNEFKLYENDKSASGNMFLMNNVINNSNIYTKTNAIIVGTTGIIGALGGVVKSHFLDKPDVEKGLKYEFFKYKRAVAQNEIDIKDTFECAAKNQKLRDDFNRLCDYWYNVGLKKVNKKNIIIGSLIGVAVGITCVAAKNSLTKNKNVPKEANTNKIQYYNVKK